MQKDITKNIAIIFLLICVLIVTLLGAFGIFSPKNPENKPKFHEGEMVRMILSGITGMVIEVHSPFKGLVPEYEIKAYYNQCFVYGHIQFTCKEFELQKIEK